MSIQFRTRAGRLVAALALATVVGGVFLAGSPDATAYSDKVETACRDDYFRLCPGYPVGSASLRLCMEAKSRQMSQSCIKALVDSGEVDRRRLKRGN